MLPTSERKPKSDAHAASASAVSLRKQLRTDERRASGGRSFEGADDEGVGDGAAAEGDGEGAAKGNGLRRGGRINPAEDVGATFHGCDDIAASFGSARANAAASMSSTCFSKRQRCRDRGSKCVFFSHLFRVGEERLGGSVSAHSAASSALLA